MTAQKKTAKSIQIGCKANLRIEDVGAFSRDESAKLVLGDSAATKLAMNRSLALQAAYLKKNEDIYGITTGFGSSSRNRFNQANGIALQNNLVKYHGCGIGEPLSKEIAAASLLARTHCLSLGHSAVSEQLVEQLLAFANHRVFPVMPAQGSVGASGDLTPLSYLAAALQGDRQVYYKGEIIEATKVLPALNLPAYSFKEREALALMNGTSVMTAVASLAWLDAKALADSACTLTGLIVELFGSTAAPFMSALHERKPHPGQIRAAKNIYELINNPDQRIHRGSHHAASNNNGARGAGIQDCYSIRCAPHVIGVLYDALDWTRSLIETELNSVNDNPVFCADEEQILNGGHFFGGHIAMACDTLKTAVSNVINLMDRHLALIMEVANSPDSLLPENLVARDALGANAWLHHGFKAMQISLSALAAEIQKNSMPMGVFSRPTESMNQDVVSMGTIAARDLYTLNAMAMNAMAIQAMAVRQAFYVKSDAQITLNDRASKVLERMSSAFNPVIEDRPLDLDIVRMREEFLKSNLD